MKAEETQARDDGGPAFPQDKMQRATYRSSAGYEVEAEARAMLQGGMTLRDYFAAKAMAPLMSALPPMPNPVYSEVPDQYALVAREAYRYADAMLEARKK